MANTCQLFYFLFLLYSTSESEAAIAPNKYKTIDNQVKNETGGFTLTISTNDPNFLPTLELALKEEKDEFLNSTDLIFVTGQIKSETTDSAWGSILNGKFFGKFTYNSKTYVIEDSSMFDLQISKAIIFEEGDFDNTNTEMKNDSAPTFKVIKNEKDIEGALKSWTPTDGNICTMKVIIARSLFNTVMEKSKSKATMLVKQHEKSLNQIYRNNQIKIGQNYFEFKVVKIDIHDDNYCQDKQNSVSCKYWSRDESEEFLESHAATDHSDYCLTFLFTDHDFSGTLGIAYVEAICNQYRRTRVRGSIKKLSTNSGFITFHGSRSSETHVHTWAHEVGHNMGSNHDSQGNGCPPSGYLMAAYAPRTVTPQDKKFSTCSQGQIKRALENIRKDYSRQCLKTKEALIADVGENPHRYEPDIKFEGSETGSKYTIAVGIGVALLLILIIGVFVVCLGSRRDMAIFKTKTSLSDKYSNARKSVSRTVNKYGKNRRDSDRIEIVQRDSNDWHEYNQPEINTFQNRPPPNIRSSPNMRSPPNIRTPPNVRTPPKIRTPPNMRSPTNNRMPSNILTPVNTRTPPNIPQAPNSRLPANIGWNNQPNTGRIANDRRHIGLEAWQAGELTREEAETRLERARKGEFIMRKSKGLDVLSVKDHGRIRHIKLQREGGKYTGDSQNYFDSLQQLVSYYRKNEIPNTNIILV